MNPMIVYSSAIFFTFGDTPELCQALIDLVRCGKKCATCGALTDFSDEGTPLPVVGRQDIALNWDGTPEFLIASEAVELVRFCDVGAAFALAEGENETLEGWRQDHQAYFERNGGFAPEMILVCEYFRVVQDFAEE